MFTITLLIIGVLLIIYSLFFYKRSDILIKLYDLKDMPNPHKAQRIAGIILGLSPLIFLILVKYYNINKIYFILAITIAIAAIDVYRKLNKAK